MSILRKKSQVINARTYLDNRLTTFTNPPIKTGNLHVEKNETVGENLDVSGNLTIGRDLRARNFYASGNYYLNSYILIPFGTIIQSAAVNVPDGWLNCNGASLGTTVYANLFGAIGYTYGGSGSNFNIPDIRGRVGVGAGSAGGLSNRILGVTGGAETHTLSVNEMPSHSHTLTRRSNPDNGAFDTNSAHATESSAATTDREVLGTFSTNATGGGLAHNNMQPFIVIHYFIKY
jgi:microcystin-dependent protein